MTTILWRRLDRPGHEVARVDEQTLSGTAVFAHEGAPCVLTYEVRCDEEWETTSAWVKGFVGERTIDVRISTMIGLWMINGKKAKAVEGCIDVDFNFSPSTNLLPIRRAGGGKVTAAWLRFPSFDLQPLEQTYERIDEHHYRYSSATGFTAEIEVDDDGLVTRYPGLCEQV